MEKFYAICNLYLHLKPKTVIWQDKKIIVIEQQARIKTNKFNLFIKQLF